MVKMDLTAEGLSPAALMATGGSGPLGSGAWSSELGDSELRGSGSRGVDDVSTGVGPGLGLGADALVASWSSRKAWLSKPWDWGSWGPARASGTVSGLRLPQFFVGLSSRFLCCPACLSLCTHPSPLSLPQSSPSLHLPISHCSYSPPPSSVPVPFANLHP